MISLRNIEFELSEIQKNKKNFDYKIDNFSIWSIIKRPLFYSVFNNLNNKKSINVEVDKSKILFLFRFGIVSICSFFDILRIFIKNKFSKKDIILVFLNYNRSYKDGNKLVEPFFGEIENIQLGNFKVITINNIKGKRNRLIYPKTDIRDNFIKFPAFFYKINFYRTRKIKNKLKLYKLYLEETLDGSLNKINQEVLSSINSKFISYKLYSFQVELKKVIGVIKNIKT